MAPQLRVIFLIIHTKKLLKIWQKIIYEYKYNIFKYSNKP